MSWWRLWRTKRQLKQGISGATEAIRALARSRDDRSVELLIEALNHASFSVQADAADALGEIRDERAVGPLIEMFTNADVDSSTRKVAAFALARIGSPQAVEFLISITRESLSGNGHDAVWLMADALPIAGGERVMRELIDIYKDNEFDLFHKEAIEGLLLLAHIRQPQVHAEWFRHHESITNDEMVEILIEALKDQDNADIRCDVAADIYKLGDQRAVEPLIAALADEDEGVRGFAAQSLGYLGNKKAVKPLIACFRNWVLMNPAEKDIVEKALTRLCRDDMSPLITALQDTEIKGHLFHVLYLISPGGTFEEQLPPDLREEWRKYKESVYL